MIYLITFQIKLAMKVILETISRPEYCVAKQMRALRGSWVGARPTERQPGVSSLLTELLRPTSSSFLCTLHWAFRTHQANLVSQMSQSRNQRCWQSSRLFLLKNDITDSPDNSSKLTSLDTQNKSSASSMDSADPNATLFSSLLLKKEKTKTHVNFNCKYADLQSF